MRIGSLVAMVAAIALGACAGRDPQPIATVQVQDHNASCTQLMAEIEGNNIRVKELANEQGWKVTQNVLTGAAGVFIPVLWFGMDWKGSAWKDASALICRRGDNCVSAVYLTEHRTKPICCCATAQSCLAKTVVYSEHTKFRYGHEVCVP